MSVHSFSRTETVAVRSGSGRLTQEPLGGIRESVVPGEDMGMNFTHYDLGYQEQGALVEVTLSGSAANVRLLDTSNFHSYRAGRQHRYHGGLIRESPARLVIPSAGSWHVTVDLQGLKGNTTSAIRVVPRSARLPLPEFVSAPERSLSQLVRPAGDFEAADRESHSSPAPAKYDVFISHATEDKEKLVRPLANALVALDLRVWYDEFEVAPW